MTYIFCTDFMLCFFSEFSRRCLVGELIGAIDFQIVFVAASSSLTFVSISWIKQHLILERSKLYKMTQIKTLFGCLHKLDTIMYVLNNSSSLYFQLTTDEDFISYDYLDHGNILFIYIHHSCHLKQARTIFKFKANNLS